MTTSISVKASLKQQKGAALITGLIFMVTMTMIGVTAARMSTLEERMTGNMRDRSISMQAAELALRDAEKDILNSVVASARNISGITNFAADCGDATAATDDDGLCYNGVAGYATPVWSSVDMTDEPSVAYGSFTGASNIAGLSDQPRYIVEGMRKTPPGGGQIFYYRITVRAQGINENTVVWLQEIFSP